MPTVDAHGPPGDLDKNGRQLYFKLRKFLRDAQRWHNSDKYLLGQTCRFEQRARIARWHLQVLDDLGESWTVEGSKGQVVPHPDIRIMEAAERAFVDGLKELGLTPRAREQLGIKPPAKTAGKFTRK